MRKKNILVTAIGSFSVPAVISSLKRYFNDDIYGCDIYPSNWHYISNEFADVFRSPLVKDEEQYLEFILSSCLQYNIGLIIPSTDIEVDFFNRWRQEFIDNSIKVTIANEEFLNVARDKYILSEFSKRLSLNTIPTYTKEDVNQILFPIVAKPRDGRSSEGLVVIDVVEKLQVDNFGDHYVFQEKINGDICTVDCVRDNFGNFFSIPRVELLRTKNGAGTTVKIFNDDFLNSLCKKICESLNVVGSINIEFIINSNGYYLMDINPRLSAGVGFSILAGYDFVENHIKAFNSETISKQAVVYDEFIAYKHMIDIKNNK